MCFGEVYVGQNINKKMLNYLFDQHTLLTYQTQNQMVWNYSWNHISFTSSGLTAGILYLSVQQTKWNTPSLFNLFNSNNTFSVYIYSHYTAKESAMYLLAVIILQCLSWSILWRRPPWYRQKDNLYYILNKPSWPGPPVYL